MKPPEHFNPLPMFGLRAWWREGEAGVRFPRTVIAMTSEPTGIRVTLDDGTRILLRAADLEIA